MFETLDIKPIFLAINGSLTSKKSGISTTCNGEFDKFKVHLNFVYKSKGLDVFVFVYKDTKLYSYQFML